MFNRIEDFVQEFEAEAAVTERVLDALTNESLSQRVTDKHRTLGGIAWHLVQSFNYLTYLGLTYDEPLAGDEPPAEAAAIAAEYRRLKGAFLRALQSQWTDETLLRTAEMGGELWANGASLRFTLRHEIHHRGQMTVLMRQAGLRVPAVVGETRDDWIDRGKKPLP